MTREEIEAAVEREVEDIATDPGDLLDRLSWTLKQLYSYQNVPPEVLSELERQEKEYGSAHDDSLRPNDWVALITKHIGKAVFSMDPTGFRRRMVIVAALAVSAIKAADRAQTKTA